MALKVSDGMAAWIEDFKKSDAPQFKGKSDKERRDQAIAAYLSAKKGDDETNEANDYKVQVSGPDGAGIHKVKARNQDHAHQLVMKKIGQSKLPRHMQPKTRIMGESVDELSMYTSKKLPNLSYPKKKTKHEKEKDRINMLRKNKQKDESVNELKTSTINNYAKKSMASSDRATNSAVATILRKGDHSKDLNTMRKRKKGMELAKSRSVAKLRKESVNEEMNFAVSIEGLPQMFISADSPGMLKQTLRKIVKQPSMIQSVKRVTDAQVKKTFRLKAQGRDEESEE